MKRYVATMLGASFLWTACSSPDVTPEETSSARLSEQLTMDASEETRSELGVVAWGIDRSASRTTSVRGYNASHKRVVEFDQRATRNFAGEQTASRVFDLAFVATVRTKGKVATLEIEAGSESKEVREIENTFGDDDDARRVVERFAADLKSQPVRETESGNEIDEVETRARTANVRPLEDGLVQSGAVCLLEQCGVGLSGSVSAGTSATSECQSGGSRCADRVASASDAQQGAESKCACGDCKESVTVDGPAIEQHVQRFADEACCFVEACTSSTYDGHQPSANLALDMLTSESYGNEPTDGHALGDKLADFAVTNMSEYRIEYVIYRQRINMGSGWEAMEDRGSITQNHFDHVHVSFLP